MDTHLGSVREVEEIIHDLIGEVELAVGEQEELGAALTDAGQEHWQSFVLEEAE